MLYVAAWSRCVGNGGECMHIPYHAPSGVTGETPTLWQPAALLFKNVISPLGGGGGAASCE